MLFIWHVEFQQHTMRRLWSCLQGFVSVSRQAFDLWHHGLLKLPRVHLRRTCSKDKTRLYQTFASATSASARRVTSSTSAVLVIAIVAFVQGSRTNSSPRPIPMFPRPPGGIPANTTTHKAPKLSRQRFFATYMRQRRLLGALEQPTALAMSMHPGSPGSPPAVSKLQRCLSGTLNLDSTQYNKATSDLCKHYFSKRTQGHIIY